MTDLIPKNFRNSKTLSKTGNAGIFAGSLELAKEGNISIKQDNLFEDKESLTDFDLSEKIVTPFFESPRSMKQSVAP